MPKVSIIIVNYNSGDYLFRCLKSISNNVLCEYEVIIVDNQSSDTSFINCMNHFDNEKFKFINAHSNLGFAKGNNVGVKQSSGDILHFLNPDTELPKGITDDYLRTFDNPDIVYINKLQNLDKTIVKSGHLIPTIENYLKSLFGQGEKWHIGASVILSKENFYKIGEWNEAYFMYYEDLDLFYRIYRYKLKVEILPSIILHIGGGCSSNVWSNKERIKKVLKAEKQFYKINGIYWQYKIVKALHQLYEVYKSKN